MSEHYNNAPQTPSAHTISKPITTRLIPTLFLMRFSSKQGGIKIQSCSGDKNSFTPNPCNICKDSDPALVLFLFEDCEGFSKAMQRLVMIIHTFMFKVSHQFIFRFSLFDPPKN